MPTSVTTHFCFPEISAAERGKDAFVDAMIAPIAYHDQVGYAGLAKQEYLRNTVHHFSGDELHFHTQLNDTEKERIHDAIQQVTTECCSLVQLPSFSIFIFPWLVQPTPFVRKMGGVNGIAPYKHVIHLYVAPHVYTYTFFKKALAHELNHLVFYDRQGFYDWQTSLRETLIFDGLAENFKEDIVKERSEVSGALTREESKDALADIFPKLDTPISFEPGSLYKHLFFGGEMYKRWTGYAVGYHIVQSFREAHSGLSWGEIMETDSHEIFEHSPFVREIKKEG